MNLEYFISELKKMQPSEELMLKRGFTSIPYSIKRNYDLERVKRETRNASNLIIDLFNNYDPQYLSFADFSFGKVIRNIDEFKVFCSSSGSFLAFRGDDSEIIEYDFEELSILYYCAKNAEMFLSALLEIFRLQSLRLQGIVERNDEYTNKDFLTKCILIAGGNKYSNFYKQLIY